jgi:hypothetical protein
MVPPDKFVEEIIDISYNFIWNNKPDKIKRKTLIADYENGGQKMLDIPSFLKAQKVMWVKRLIKTDNASWKAVPDLYFKKCLSQDTWKCDPTCIIKQKNFPDFYWQILKCWCEVKNFNNEIITPIEIRRQCLWYNKNIKVNKKEIWSQKFREHGINQIHDIVSIDGNFLTHKELETKFDFKCDGLKYNSIKDAIPIQWRKTIKTMKVPQDAISFQEQPFLKINKVHKPIQIITNKEIYWSYVIKKQVEPIIKEKMQVELNIKENQWNEIFTSTKDIKYTKIRAFQYKILYSLIPCNSYLQKIKRSITDKCSVCNLSDDLVHYFYKCADTMTFWDRFKSWWKQMTGDIINLDKTDIIVGCLKDYDKKITLNNCILLAKWNIYKSKLDQSNISFYKFLCDIKYNMRIEKAIALKNNQLTKFDKLWEMVESFVT